jgi:uncharacterized membrane protein (DUF485 family)
MIPQQLIDPIPIPILFVFIVMLLLVGFEVGFRIGRWWQTRTPEDTEGPTGVLVGSLLALMAFLLAITMGMAADRFDRRRALVLEEANAIGTTFLRAGYIPAPMNDESRELLRQYAPLRVAVTDPDELEAHLNTSQQILDDLWARAEIVGRDFSTDANSLYIESLNEVIDMNTSRIIAGIYGRVPETVVLLLIFGAALTLGMVGYGAGLTYKRSELTALTLCIALAAVLTLVIDLDRPRDGFITVSQEPLILVQQQIGPPQQTQAP